MAVIYGSAFSTNPYYTSVTSSSSSTVTSSSSSTSVSTWNGTVKYGPYYLDLKKKLKIDEGQEATITLPNGATLKVEADGSYTVEDSGKVIYKGCKIREFNQYINASDLLEEFIRFMGQNYDIRQGEILDIPIELFITWLIMKACEQDNDEVPPDILKIEDHHFVKKDMPRCRYCGRFIYKKFHENGINFCNTDCMNTFSGRILGTKAA